MISSEEAPWQFTLNNLCNRISGVAPETVKMKVVAYGPGMAFLKKGGVDAAEIQKAGSTPRPLHGVRQRLAKRTTQSIGPNCRQQSSPPGSRRV